MLSDDSDDMILKKWLLCCSMQQVYFTMDITNVNTFMRHSDDNSYLSSFVLLGVGLKMRVATDKSLVISVYIEIWPLYIFLCTNSFPLFELFL
jgi:hypothetical protein